MDSLREILDDRTGLGKHLRSIGDDRRFAARGDSVRRPRLCRNWRRERSLAALGYARRAQGTLPIVGRVAMQLKACAKQR
jgi:hypothetical protein